MFMKYLLTYETLSKFSKKLRRNDYFLTKKEFFTTLNPEMPDELLEYIYSWDKIKKSPYSNDSYYNDNKSWSSFVDGAIRVSDHWNFIAQDKIHCLTKQKDIENNKYWYVGVYDEKNDNYDLINRYPILHGRLKDESKFWQKLRVEIKLFDKQNDKPNDELQKTREFKDRIKNGLVKAKLGNGEIVDVKWRGTRGYKKDHINVIKYEKDGILFLTSDYQIIGEFLQK